MRYLPIQIMQKREMFLKRVPISIPFFFVRNRGAVEEIFAL